MLLPISLLAVYGSSGARWSDQAGNVASAFVFPDISQADCAVLAVPVPMLPFLLGALAQLKDQRYWETDQDWQAAYEAIAAIEASAMTACISDLIESNNRIYRLLDWSLNGNVYSAGDNPPETITPSIPAVPSEDTFEPGLVREIFKLRLLLDNVFNADINQDYVNPVSVRDQLQAIIDALAADDADITNILEQLEAIALLLG
jgi:hypothetical protein